MADYIVKKGDTLSDIAKKHGTTYQDIAKANGISNPNLIYPGQKLTIGGSTTSKPTTTPADGGFNYGNYKQSNTVTQAGNQLTQHNATKPGAYQSQWQTQLNDAINKILNRENFSYDLNGDALYQQYKDQYVTMGQQAMMDTMGQASAMTGGYGNSYAQTAGQQIYQGHLQQLNDRVPELYQLALDQYNREGDEMYNQYALLSGKEEQDYGRYRDAMTDWQTERDYLADRYDIERDYDYGQYRDAIADEQWQKEFDLLTKGSSVTGDVPGADISDSNNTVDKDSNKSKVSDANIKTLQKFLGITPDGKWGPQSQAAAKKKWGVTSVEEAFKKYQDSMRPGVDDLLGGMVKTGTVVKTAKDQYGRTTTTTKKVDKGTVAGQRDLKSATAAEIKALYKAGEISYAEYQRLMQVYAPRGYTY